MIQAVYSLLETGKVYRPVHHNEISSLLCLHRVRRTLPVANAWCHLLRFTDTFTGETRRLLHQFCDAFTISLSTTTTTVL